MDLISSIKTFLEKRGMKTVQVAYGVWESKDANMANRRIKVEAFAGTGPGALIEPLTPDQYKQVATLIEKTVNEHKGASYEDSDEAAWTFHGEKSKEAYWSAAHKIKALGFHIRISGPLEEDNN